MGQLSAFSMDEESKKEGDEAKMSSHTGGADGAEVG